MAGWRIEQHGRVLAPKLHAQRSKDFRCTPCYFMCNVSATNESDMADARVRGEIVGSLWPTRESSRQVRVMAAGCEGTTDDVNEVAA